MEGSVKCKKERGLPVGGRWLISHEYLLAFALDRQCNVVEDLVNQRLPLDIPEREQNRH